MRTKSTLKILFDIKLIIVSLKITHSIPSSRFATLDEGGPDVGAPRAQRTAA